jgi:hypothetical protein
MLSFFLSETAASADPEPAAAASVTPMVAILLTQLPPATSSVRDRTPSLR